VKLGEAQPAERRLVASVDAVDLVYRRAGSQPVQALQSLDLAVAKGEFLGLVGPSGCGKTTTMRLIAGLIPPTQGGVWVEGLPAVEARKKRLVGVAFQQPALLAWRTVLGNVLLPSELHTDATPGADSPRERAEHLLDLVGLRDFADRYPGELSGGMQHRVAIARAFSRTVSLLLMDEPFAAVDEITRSRLNLELQRLWAEFGFSVLFITHSVAEACFLSDRVVVLSTRPGHVRGEVVIPFGRPRPAEIRQSTEFLEITNEVLAYLNHSAC
jgi:NitT/TauT family transport system ATP-binding protein